MCGLLDEKAQKTALWDMAHPTVSLSYHSYSELVLYPWGDDQNQTTDPNQNFQNPAFDGQRGTPGNNYKEYIPADVEYYAPTDRGHEAQIKARLEELKNRKKTGEPRREPGEAAAEGTP